MLEFSHTYLWYKFPKYVPEYQIAADTSLSPKPEFLISLTTTCHDCDYVLVLSNCGDTIFSPRAYLIPHDDFRYN